MSSTRLIGLLDESIRKILLLDCWQDVLQGRGWFTRAEPAAEVGVFFRYEHGPGLEAAAYRDPCLLSAHGVETNVMGARVASGQLVLVFQWRVNALAAEVVE